MTENLKDNLEIRETTFAHDFRLINPHDGSFGDTYTDTKQVFVNLVPHETIEQIYDTLHHEDIHAALVREDMNDDIEHTLIKKILQIHSGMV